VSSEQRIPEQSDAFVKLTLKDEDGSALGVGAINSLTWTLYDEETGGIINSRQDQAETVTANPHYLRLEPDDNVIVTVTKDAEVHVLEVKYAYNSARANGLTARKEIRLIVEDLEKVS